MPFIRCTRAASLSCKRATRFSCPSLLPQWCTARTLLATLELSVWTCKRGTTQGPHYPECTGWITLGAAPKEKDESFHCFIFLFIKQTCEGCVTAGSSFKNIFKTEECMYISIITS